MKHKKKLALLALGCTLAVVVAFLGWRHSEHDPDVTFQSWLDDMRQAQNVGEFWDALRGETARARQRRNAQLFLVLLASSRNVRHAHLEFEANANQLEGATRDWPLFGGTPQRNMVNLTAKNVPTDWSVEPGKQKDVKWAADLGNTTNSGPVVADGRVFVGTNNAKPRNPKIKGANKAVLMCFNEADGKFLWQNVHDFPDNPVFQQALPEGLCSTPCVEGKFLYYILPGCEVVCADTATGKVQWTYDMMKELKVIPYHTAACSPLVVGDLVFVVTGNGVDEEFKVVSPKAPSFAAIHKKTGKLAWSSNLPGERIIEGQWSNPTLAVVNGKEQVIFPGGDCWLYSFEPTTGKLLWKCNCNPQRPKGEQPIDNHIIATPVVVGERVYVGLGVAPGGAHTPKFSYVVCFDITKSGDVSPKTLKADDAANKDSALVWAFGGPIQPVPKRGRAAFFGSTISTCAVAEGLLWIAEDQGYVHCLDAKTGQRHWEYDIKASIWGSPYFVDGKVYLGTEDGEVAIFQTGKGMKLLNKVDMGELIHSTPVVANGAMFITTKTKLYAIAGK
jgi:outer membrane protein assembly factor BamB